MIGKNKNNDVLLKDIASINKSIVHVQTLSRTNGRKSILLNLIKTPSADVTKVSQAVMNKLNKISEIKNGEIEDNILINRGSAVSEAINGLWREGLLGCIFSILCVFVFFRQWRSSLAVILSLPICFFGSVAVLNAMGLTLNLLTAAGLIVSMGRVVDDSIVILDNMYRKLEHQRSFSIGGMASGVKEMIPAVVSSTLTTIAVYLPLALTETMVGHAFSGFAWAVTISLVFSLIVSLVILPPFAALSWKRKFVLNAPRTERLARPLLEKLLRKKNALFAGMCAALILTAAAAFFVPVKVLPRSHANDLNVQIECPEGSTLKQVSAEVRSFEALLEKDADIQTYSSTMGASFSPVFDDVFDQAGGWIQQGNVANIFVTPKKGASTEKVNKELKQDIKQVSSHAVYTVSSQKISGDDSRVSVTLTGSSHKKLSKMANLLKNKLQMIKGLQMSGEANGNDQLLFNIVLNDQEIQKFGLNKQAILNKLESFMYEHQSLNLNLNGHSVPVDITKSSALSVKYQQGADPTKKILLQLGHLTFKGEKGKQISLSRFSNLNVEPSTAKSFKDGEPAAIVTGNIITQDIGHVTKQVKETIIDMNFPNDVKVDYGGISQQMKQMIWSISMAAIVSLILVLCIISAVFKGIRGPLGCLIIIAICFYRGILIHMALWGVMESWRISRLSHVNWYCRH